MLKFYILFLHKNKWTEVGFGNYFLNKSVFDRFYATWIWVLPLEFTVPTKERFKYELNYSLVLMILGLLFILCVIGKGVNGPFIDFIGAKYWMNGQIWTETV